MAEVERYMDVLERPQKPGSDHLSNQHKTTCMPDLAPTISQFRQPVAPFGSHNLQPDPC